MKSSLIRTRQIKSQGPLARRSTLLQHPRPKASQLCATMTRSPEQIINRSFSSYHYPPHQCNSRLSPQSQRPPTHNFSRRAISVQPKQILQTPTVFSRPHKTRRLCNLFSDQNYRRLFHFSSLTQQQYQEPVQVFDILHLGHPHLRKKAEAVDIAELKTAKMKKLIKQIKVHFQNNPEDTGLAAPQIDVPKRFFAANIVEDPGSELKPMPLQFFFNPEVQINDNSDKPEKRYSSWEGCLSVPHFLGKVARPSDITVTYFDEFGTKKKMRAKNFMASVIQHEVDHLDGIVFLERMDKSEIRNNLVSFDEMSRAQEIGIEIPVYQGTWEKLPVF